MYSLLRSSDLLMSRRRPYLNYLTLVQKHIHISNAKMMAFAFQLYIGFLLLQGASMKSIQNTTDPAISIASLKSAVDRLEERIENMTVIQTQGKVFIIRKGKQLERPGDTELMGREPLYTTSEDRVPEPDMESIYCC